MSYWRAATVGRVQDVCAGTAPAPPQSGCVSGSVDHAHDDMIVDRERLLHVVLEVGERPIDVADHRRCLIVIQFRAARRFAAWWVKSPDYMRRSPGAPALQAVTGGARTSTDGMRSG